MTVAVVRGDARRLPLPDACVDLIVTSPPFWQLRSYQDGGKHYDGQIGSEATPQDYVASLLDCTREWMRVLKPGGSMFIELGDVYYSGKGSPGKGTVDAKSPARTSRRLIRSPLDYGLDHPRKCLLDLPHRYVIRCVDDLGLIKRAEIIWHHVNGLPESVTDRVRRSHSVVFHLVRQPRYYAAVDEIREPHAYPGDTDRGWNRSRNGRIDSHDDGTRKDGNAFGGAYSERHLNPLGKLPGSVWEIPSSPLVVPPRLGVSHFAAFPPALVRPIVLGWSPPGVCAECGQGRRPVADGSEKFLHRPGAVTRLGDTDWQQGALGGNGTKARHDIGNVRTVHRITGYTCACPAPDAPTRPALVLDPFAGTGTTMLVASAYGRIGVGVDLSADYARLARWRTSDPGERARALGVPKPPRQLEGQDALFEVTG